LRKYAVGERGLNGAEQNVRGNDSRASVSAVSLRKTERYASRRQVCSGNHCCKSVEYVLLGFLGDFARQSAGSRLSHVVTERRHERAARLLDHAHTTR